MVACFILLTQHNQLKYYSKRGILQIIDVEYFNLKYYPSFGYFVFLNEITKRYKLIKNIIELKGKRINIIASFNSIM